MNFKWNVTTQSDFNEIDTWELNKKNEAGFAGFKNNRAYSEIVESFKNGSNRPCYCATAKIGKTVCGFVLASHKFGETNPEELVIELIVTNPKMVSNGFGSAMIFDVVKNCEQIFGLKAEKIKAIVNGKNSSSKKAFLKNNFVDNNNELTEQQKLEDENYIFGFERKTDPNLEGENKNFKKEAKKTIKALK